MLFIAGGCDSGTNAPVSALRKDLLGAGEHPEMLLLGNRQKLLILGFPKRVAGPLLGLCAEDRRYQLVPAFADLRDYALGRHVKPQPLERAAPGLDVGRVGVDQGPVDVENHSTYSHGSKLVENGKMREVGEIEEVEVDQALSAAKNLIRCAQNSAFQLPRLLVP